MSIVEQGKCKIETISNEGIGIGRTELGSVELPYTLPGEVVEFERHRYRRKSSWWLKNIAEPSIARITPSCKYFGACGGCLLQHLNKENYDQFKYNLINAPLQLANIQTNISPIMTIPPGQRRRINLQVLKKEDKIYLGFHRFRSHQIINIDSCPVILPELSKLLEPLKIILLQLLQQQRKAEVFLSYVSNGIALIVATRELLIIEEQVKALIANFANEYGIIKVVLRYRKIVNLLYEAAEPYILFDDVAVAIEADSFIQSSFLSDQILTDLVLKYAETSKANNNAIDLFCGRGTYTLPLSRQFAVDGFELDSKAIAALEKAALQANRPIKVASRNLLTTPVSKLELEKYSLAVINPPRTGSKLQCIELAASSIGKIIYISCNPTTFAEDAKLLCQGGYQLKEITPVDQFYWSPHLEVVGLFERS